MFTLAHLSDPHLGPIPTPRLVEIINKRGLGLINWYRKRHRHHSRAVLDAIVRGNHDAYIRHVAGHAARHWGEYMRGDDGAEFPFVRRRGPVAIIGLTT